MLIRSAQNVISENQTGKIKFLWRWAVMPKRLVYDIDIMYEAYGRGETIVYLQSVVERV